MPGSNARARISQLVTVAVPVSDQDRALEFYRGTLGFENRRDAPMGAGRWIEVAPPGGATTLALVPPGDGRIGIDTGIRFATDDATTLHADLRAAGVDVDAEVLRWGGGVPPMFVLRDPDGNRLVVVEQPTAG